MGSVRMAGPAPSPLAQRRHGLLRLLDPYIPPQLRLLHTFSVTVSATESAMCSNVATTTAAGSKSWTNAAASSSLAASSAAQELDPVETMIKLNPLTILIDQDTSETYIELPDFMDVCDDAPLPTVVQSMHWGALEHAGITDERGLLTWPSKDH